MTPTECVDVVEFLAARCPAMRMHENTPDSWYVDLAAYSRDDALEAVRRRSRQQSFVSLAEILDELDTIVRHRAGRERLAALEQRIADENPPAPLQQRPVDAITVGQPIPRPADLLRRETLRARRAPDFEAATQAAAERRARREAARTEIDQARTRVAQPPTEDAE